VKWAAQLAHEVRTPLYAARNLLEDLVAVPDLPAEAHADLELVEATVLEGLRLVDEQLLAVRQSAGRPSVRVSTVTVEELLQALRGMMRPLIRPGVTFVIDAPDGIPPLHTDAGKIAQILRNLVSNALRHTAAGGVRVHTYLVDDDQAVAFTVSDTGEGIPAAFREHVFEEYAQVPGATNRSGTGLGLPLAAGLAAVLGGSVSLTRNSDAGATFTATIPLRFHTDDPAVIVVEDDGSLPRGLLG
jgi:signal transduction histidine kinase